MKRLLPLALVLFAVAESQAQSLEFVKRIPIAVDASSRIKDVAVDASGNLYVTQYFGSNHEIKKVTDPIGNYSITDFTSTLAYGSSTGACLATDPAGNVYFSYCTAYDNTYVVKVKADGSLDTTFGTAGVAPVGGGTRQARQISYSSEGGGRIIVTGWGAAPALIVLNASTGATINVSPNTLGDTADKGFSGTAITTGDTWSGHYYDASAKVIYGNAMGDLVKMSVSGLDAIDGGTQQIMTYHGRNNDSANGLAANTELGVIAYSGVVSNNVASSWATNIVRFYDMNTGKETQYFFPLTGDGKLDFYSTSDASSYTNGGAMAWIKKGADWYLVFNNMYGSCLNVYKYDATPKSQLFNYVKSITLEVETGASAKSFASLSNGDILYGSYYATSPIKRVSDPLGAATVSNFTGASFPSTSGNVVATDANDNVYFSVQSATAGTGGVYKFDASGNAVTSFGINGISMPAVGALTAAVPHSLKVVGDRILVGLHSSPYMVAVYNATTGAPVGNAATTFPVYKPSDNSFSSSVSPKTLWFDLTNNYFYGNMSGALVRWPVSGGIDTLPTTTLDATTAQVVGPNLPGGGDMSTLSVDPTGTWVAWPAAMDRARATAIAAGGQFPWYLGLYNTGTGEVQYLYDMANGDQVFNQGAGSTWFVKNGKTYLAVCSYYKGNVADPSGNRLRIFEYVGPKSAVADWSQF